MKLRNLILLSFVFFPIAGSSQPGHAKSNENAKTSRLTRMNDVVAGAWQLYRSIFMTPDGRIVDPENGSISHSEGQGYGMLIAVAADDRESFDRLWAWTESELQIRDDGLSAWKWDPTANPHVLDKNNATDGDLLIAWALLRAYKQWNVQDHLRGSEAIVENIIAKTILKTEYGSVILPGADGFASKDRKDGPVVNLSYWVFPAIEELGRTFPAFGRLGLSKSGMALLKQMTESGGKLPSDWTSLSGGGPHPAEGFPAQFGYNALRIPLYLVWGDVSDRRLMEALGVPFGHGAKAANPAVIDVSTGAPVEALDAPGYRAIGAAIACNLGDERVSINAQGFEPTTYYASTLHILTLMALSERYPQCF